jgi:hypothetical protein
VTLDICAARLHDQGLSSPRFTTPQDVVSWRRAVRAQDSRQVRELAPEWAPGSGAAHAYAEFLGVGVELTASMIVLKRRITSSLI